MLNRIGSRYYLLSQPLRRVAPRAFTVHVELCWTGITTRPAPLLASTRPPTNPASSILCCLRFDRHASSMPPSSPTDATDRKKGIRETSPLTGSTTTESSNGSEPFDGEVNEIPTESLSWKERAKTFAVEYGRVGIATHIVLSVLSISAIYAAISCGLDVSGLLHWLGISTESAGKDGAAEKAGSFILAYAVYKVAAPLRWPLTFAVTPVVMRALRRRGYMLPATKTNAHRSPRPHAEDRTNSDTGINPRM